MSANKAKEDRKKVAVTLQTYDMLKAFSRQNAVKMRLLIDAMAEIALQDEQLSQQMVELALSKEAKE
jgi:hypothetical protein